MNIDLHQLTPDHSTVSLKKQTTCQKNTNKSDQIWEIWEEIELRKALIRQKADGMPPSQHPSYAENAIYHFLTQLGPLQGIFLIINKQYKTAAKLTKTVGFDYSFNCLAK